MVFFMIGFVGKLFIVDFTLIIMQTKFLVHTDKDFVGVATYDLKRAENVEGVFLDDNHTLDLTAIDDIPLGHKIALRDIAMGEKVIEYGEPIGVTTSHIRKGAHVHIHNIKSMRW